jgi:hypothetical protein
MQHQESPSAQSSSSHEQQAMSPQATAGLSKQAFREMLAAAERVNRHHLAQKSARQSS